MLTSSLKPSLNFTSNNFDPNDENLFKDKIVQKFFQIINDFLKDAQKIFSQINIFKTPKLIFKNKEQKFEIESIEDLNQLLPYIKRNIGKQKIEFYFYLPTLSDRKKFITKLSELDSKWSLFNKGSDQNTPAKILSDLKSYPFSITPNPFFPVVFILKYDRIPGQKQTQKTQTNSLNFSSTHKTIFRETLQCIFCQGILTIDENFFDKIDIEKLQKKLSFNNLLNFENSEEKELQEQFEKLINFISQGCKILVQNGYDVVTKLKNLGIDIFTTNYQQNKLLLVETDEFYSWIETAKSIKKFLNEQGTGQIYFYFEHTDNFKLLKTKFFELNNALPESQKFSQINKWNSSDIWAISVAQKSKIYQDIEQSKTLEELNEIIKKGFEQKLFLGISLKKIKPPDKARIKIYNKVRGSFSIKIEPSKDFKTAIILGGVKDYLNSSMGQIYATDVINQNQMKIEFRFDRKKFKSEYLNTEIVFYDLSTKSRFRLGKAGFSSLIKYINNFDTLSSYTKTFFKKFLDKTEMTLTKEHFQNIKDIFWQILTEFPGALFSGSFLDLNGGEIFLKKIDSLPLSTNFSSSLHIIYNRLKKLNEFSQRFSLDDSGEIVSKLPNTEKLFYQDLFQVFLRKLQINNDFNIVFQEWSQWFIVMDLFSQMILYLLEANELESFVTEAYKFSTAQTDLSSVFIGISP